MQNDARRAYAAGQRNMRERARDACDECREAIEALPIEEEPTCAGEEMMPVEEASDGDND